jgi:hypothetical protein
MKVKQQTFHSKVPILITMNGAKEGEFISLKKIPL